MLLAAASAYATAAACLDPSSWEAHAGEPLAAATRYSFSSEVRWCSLLLTIDFTYDALVAAFSSSHQYVIKSDEESSHRGPLTAPTSMNPQDACPDLQDASFLRRELASCKGTSQKPEEAVLALRALAITDNAHQQQCAVSTN